jgi:tRNA pseudouridine38-40 synthase
MDPSIATVRGASRTDAGVHARGQLCALDPDRRIPPRGWVLGMNAHLPHDVAIRRARLVPRGFEPRASRAGKRYRYVVLRDAIRDPAVDRRAWRIDDAIDLEAVRDEARALVGTHDFRAFRSSKDPRTDTVRTIMGVELREGLAGDDRLLGIEVEGTAFLHNMVRIIAGTLVDVGRKHLPSGAVGRALASGKRDHLGMTAPAHGLLLDEVRVDLPSPLEGESWP